MTEEKVIDLLTNISSKGFTLLQAKAYIAVLKLGEATGSAIAEQAGINRSKIYDVLGDLELMGAVQRISREGKTRYIGVDPKIVFKILKERFVEDLDNSIEILENVISAKELIDEKAVTFSRIQIKNLNVNEFKMMISTTEKARSQFLEMLSPENRPKEHVILLELEQKREEDFILLIGDYEALLFNPPTSNQIKNALRFLGRDFSLFLQGVVQHLWDERIPAHIDEEIREGERKLLAKGVATNMHYILANGTIRHQHLRPVPVLITDSHISFLYQGEEDPKIPIRNIRNIKTEGNFIECEIFSATGMFLARLTFTLLTNAMAISNLIDLLSKR